MDKNNHAYLIDGIKSIAIHNDIARIQFMQLDEKGNAVETLLLMVPMNQAQQIHSAMGQLAGAAGAGAAGAGAGSKRPGSPPNESWKPDERGRR